MGLPNPPLLISIGVIFCALGWIFSKGKLSNIKNNIKQPPYLFLLSVYLIHLVGITYTENYAGWLDEMRIKLPMLVLTFGFFASDTLSVSSRYKILYAFVIAISLVAFGSFTNYLLHLEELNERVLQSKEVPILTLRTLINSIFNPAKVDLFVSDLSHIYFSIMQAFAIFVSYHLYKSNQLWFNKLEKYLIVLLGIFSLICLNIFASRTGLASFYAALLVAIFWFIFIKKHYFLGLIFLLIIILSPLVVYHSLPSFQNRITNTLQDLREYKSNTDLSDWSLARRIAAWQIAYAVFKENPIFGVASADTDKAILAHYDKVDFCIDKDKRILPHNQYLEQLVGFGLAGFIIFIAGFLFCLIHAIQQRNELLIYFWIIIAVAMLVESILERQVGVSFFTFFLLFLHKHTPK